MTFRLEESAPSEISDNYGCSEGGFTLMETLVALVIVSIAIAISTVSLSANIKFNWQAEVMYEGTQAAQTIIDSLRYIPVETLPESGSDEPRMVVSNSRREFKVVVTYCEDAQYCTSEYVRQIDVQVTYKGELVYKTQVIFTALGDPSDDDTIQTRTPTPVPD